MFTVVQVTCWVGMVNPNHPSHPLRSHKV